ncbi:MAG: SMI1/KNR4 family protein [Bacteroidota bacterium]
MSEETIRRVLDKYFGFMDEIGGNSFIEELIPEELIDVEKEPPYAGIRFWRAIKSTVTKVEIRALEDYYGHRLPQSYHYFLRCRHFIALELGQQSIAFFKNLPRTLIEDTEEEIEEFYEGLIERNYLPFARISDVGVLCFDANTGGANQAYEIVGFDQEDGFARPAFCAKNFATMFVAFEAHLDDWISNRRAKE